jgi:molecular chaperone HtpG
VAGKTTQFEFQAETKQLLDLVAHSLYTDKEIFLRELVSNASDALDRLRFEALTMPELLGDDSNLQIRVEVDRQARKLTISDNGIGMSREEVVANIGTIAKSGTRELREKLQEGNSPQMLADCIGQFGVGFYSAFMVADKVSLLTSRAGETNATRWESTGDGRYTLSEESRAGRGTSVTLHLKPANPDAGIEDYTDSYIVARIVRRYSDFVEYPITCGEHREEIKPHEEDKAQDGERSTAATQGTVLNSMKPIWTRSVAEVTPEEYVDFYRHISHDWNEPFKVLTLKAEGATEYRALLFVPAKAPNDLFYHAAETGLRLYAKRVLIMERCEDLLPRYLRFIKGVVDSADLSLNISRQRLQQDRHINQIRRWLTKRILDTLHEMHAKEPEKFLEFWHQFGRALKEGASSDSENRDRILSLLLFESSNDPAELTSLGDYVARMKPDQRDIYYQTAATRAVAANSPHLEAFKQAGYEVLYLTDPVDELLVQALDYEGKKLKSVSKGAANFGTDDEAKQAEQILQEKEAAGLLDLVQKHLEAYVKQVRLSRRLVSSPACLVGTEMDHSPQLERLLQKGRGGGPKQRRIMELNPKHEIFLKMQKQYEKDSQGKLLGDYADLLLGYALVAEGSELHDPVRFNNVLLALMSRSA